jgi:phosphoribosyl 1,2-cyclic phosphodiesterase
MHFKSLGSGSGGNATLVHASSAADQCVMIDCGLGIRELERRIVDAGLQPSDVGAIVVTHEHGDHAGCVASWSRKYDCPVYLSRGTWHALKNPQFGGGMQWIQDGHTVSIMGLTVQPFTVPHDAREPLQLRLSDGQRHLGLLTDIGHATPYVLSQLQGVHSLVLECNHDLDLLQTGRYPPSLKKRVGGDWGHLANHQASAILQALWHTQLSQVVAAHLSESNNTPAHAQASLAQALPTGHSVDIVIASALTGTPWLMV